MSFFLGDQGNAWKTASLELYYRATSVYIEITGTILHGGGTFVEVQGDIAIDDVMMTSWSQCRDLTSK